MSLAPSGRRIALVSLLFEWPSTGGGVHHAVEFGAALQAAGHEVRHFHAEYPGWRLAADGASLPFPHEAVHFDDACWNAAGVVERFRAAVALWRPELVFVLVSWNAKPLLASAVEAWPYVLVLQGLETLCPLNNVRLLPGFAQCDRSQLGLPATCRACLAAYGGGDGLHARERRLAGVGGPGYDAMLRRGFAHAHAVVTMNPEIAAIVRPWARRVLVSPPALDPDRFPWPPPPTPRLDPLPVVLFSGLVDEPIKGFATLRAACKLLWQEGRKFVLAATGTGVAESGESILWLGWQAPEALPATYWAADICAVPSRAQESFGRVAAEAGAAGKPVVANRIGGLPHTVQDGVTGLLATPGDAADWAAKLSLLLDDAELMARLGDAGRARFESEFSWPVVIERDFAPMLAELPRIRRALKGVLLP